VLSYSYSGAEHVQRALSAGASLACTAGTGIIPQCAAAVHTWQRIEGQTAQTVSRLALSTIRALITAQITMIAASVGKARWCELANASPEAARAFLQVFPHTRFVCVHRSCPDVIRAGVQASPWGLQSQAMIPYLISHPGNTVAALAACWADSAEQLLAFEAAHRQAAHRLLYEDLTANPGNLTAVKASLKLGNSTAAAPEEPSTSTPQPEAKVPLEMIPEPLRKRINRLHTELSYPSPHE
jgi:hypothetical protein